MMISRTFLTALLNLTLALTASTALAASTNDPPRPKGNTSDAALLKQLPGFRSEIKDVNGIHIHYVVGGEGSPIFLLAGWPENWWAWHKIMPGLAKSHTVYAIDYRGMGESSKPADGYDKKTMAKDLYTLMLQLGYQQISVVGHDIGSQLAFSFAANYPEATTKLVMIDVPHPDASFAAAPLLPANGQVTDKADSQHAYLWWFAFHQVKGLPEQILDGREYLEQAWFFHYLLKDDNSVSELDRAVYADAYASRDAIRAGNAWYQAFPQDIADCATYKTLHMPVLALGAFGYGWLQGSLAHAADNVKLVLVEDSGHFIPEEQPSFTLDAIQEFLR